MSKRKIGDSSIQKRSTDKNSFSEIKSSAQIRDNMQWFLTWIKWT